MWCLAVDWIRQNDGTALLYAGLSDCEVGVVRIPDPFTAFERG